MSSALTKRVTEVYQNFDKNIVDALPSIYRPDIVFQDPLHRLTGIAPLANYYSTVLEDLIECHFEFDNVLESESAKAAGGSAFHEGKGVGQTVLFWTMHYRHKKLAGGKKLILTGNSHLMHRETIFFHRDYFDAGAMIYEHIPIIGRVIKGIKSRV